MTALGMSFAGLSGLAAGCGGAKAADGKIAAAAKSAEPLIPDLCMMASTDILSIDKAFADMVYNFGDARKNDLIEHIKSRKGLRELSAMKERKMGSDQYELIAIS